MPTFLFTTFRGAHRGCTRRGLHGSRRLLMLTVLADDGEDLLPSVVPFAFEQLWQTMERWQDLQTAAHASILV